MFEYVQEVGKLFVDINSLALRPASKQKTKLISLLLDCELVELVQKMWRRYLSSELLERMEKLPDHLETSLTVSIFLISALCNKLHTHSVLLIKVKAE